MGKRGRTGAHGSRNGPKEVCYLGHEKPLGKGCPTCRKSWRSERLEIIKLAKEKPCADCGQQYPHYVMDFDHVRGVKKKVVSKMRENSLSDLLDEIAKCEVVCANCHRIRTHGQGY